ncbi:MAG: M23 family metallopeptidase [Oscillospiraceae bacterium]
MNYSKNNKNKKRYLKNVAIFTAKGFALLTIVMISCVFINSKNLDVASGKNIGPAELVTAKQKIEASTVPMAPDLTIACGTFMNPTQGEISSPFGERWGRKHTGIDIAGCDNTDIFAADAGVVVYAGEMGGYGNYVKIDHENGSVTAYGHCNSLLVKDGERVKRGQVIASMGSTGNSTGTHLHFEIKKNGDFVNPCEYVSY